MGAKAMPNLSRRHLVTTAAALPALALAAAVPAVAIPLSAPATTASPLLPQAAAAAVMPVECSSELLGLGEQLKPLFTAWLKLKPRCSRAYQVAFDQAGFAGLGDNRTEKQQAEAERKFNEACKQSGYDPLYKRVNALSDKRGKMARAIYKLKANDRIGDGIRAAAALVLNDDLENGYEAEEILWEMAARAGFTPPASIAKKLRRMAAAHARKAVQS
jgi:hypothetical protein